MIEKLRLVLQLLTSEFYRRTKSIRYVKKITSAFGLKEYFTVDCRAKTRLPQMHGDMGDIHIW
jgi:hypothetical protein